MNTARQSEITKESGGDVRVYGSNGPVGWTTEALCHGPGVILGRKGAYRGVEFSPGPFFVIDTAYYVAPKSELDPRWIYYAIKYHKLGEIDDGSPVPSTTRAAVYVRPVEIPPLPEQQTIALVLGSLDDKIELNRRMNRTLESMARALFKSWFVDFDPVHANAAGNPTLPPDLAALFPSEFEPSPIGDVPKGWEVYRTSDVLEVNPRRLLKKGSIAPYVDMKNMPIDGHAVGDVIDREFKSGSKYINGDTLLARITPCLENGKTAFVDFLSNDETVGWGSTEYIVLRPKPPLPVEHAYYLARSESFRCHAIQSMSGTSGRQRVPANCFDQYWAAVPGEELAIRFGKTVRVWMERVRQNECESRTLAALRDALLPKLLSGELVVEEAAERMAAAK